MTVFSKEWCFGNMINISCAYCPYRRGYWCFKKKSKMELDKLSKEVEEGKMDKFVDLRWEND